MQLFKETIVVLRRHKFCPAFKTDVSITTVIKHEAAQSS